MIKNKYIFKLILSGDSGDVSNWQQLFDNTVWNGKATGANSEWNSTNSRWEIETGTRFADYPFLTPADTDFDIFRPTKGRVYFTGADELDILVYFDTGLNLNSGMTSGQEFSLATDVGKIVKIEFRRDDIYEIYPYITDIQFYDADFVPTVIDDLILPVSSCSINHQIQMKDSDGEDMPIWGSTDNPGDNGYDLDKSKYVINFTNITIPGEEYGSEIVSRLNNSATLYISTQTTSGIPNFQELVSGIIQSAIADTGSMSRSIRLSGKLEVPLSDVIWDYQEIEISKINYLSPNQTDGKYTWQCPGINTDIKPGFKAVYGNSEILVSEVQYIVSTSNIQFYLKE